ncbi:hypothetical protein FGO68_gene1150 [Halteria grandinella]|uniref:Uncharacterized protein n=1 Tax=Halteria grandinella TaxID=5974 RepID=A0A8J8P5M0_HALGN|nr:hypothetical protein FGO68_gene1150 [Halteria grandinella]
MSALCAFEMVISSSDKWLPEQRSRSISLRYSEEVLHALTFSYRFQSKILELSFIKLNSMFPLKQILTHTLPSRTQYLKIIKIKDNQSFNDGTC